MYKEATVLLLFVDLGNKQTVDSVDYWLREVKDNGGVCPVYIVGNKSDNRKLNPDLGKAAKERDGAYVEISCKTGEGVEALLDRIVNDFK
jgi:predicted GTPase